jgi:hypothetical protein
MTNDRFADGSLKAEPPIAPGFLLFPVAPAVAVVSPLEWIYQQMYEQAVRANQQPATRELFAIMN